MRRRESCAVPSPGTSLSGRYAFSAEQKTPPASVRGVLILLGAWRCCPAPLASQIKKTEVDKAEEAKRRQLLKFYNSTHD
jgi:hypothetical protein